MLNTQFINLNVWPYTWRKDHIVQRVVQIINKNLIRDKKTLVILSMLMVYQYFLPNSISKNYCNDSTFKDKPKKHFMDAMVFKKNTLLIEHLICKPHFYWPAFKAANSTTTKSKIGLRPTTVMLSAVQLHVVTMKKSDATIFFHVFFYYNAMFVRG